MSPLKPETILCDHRWYSPTAGDGPCQCQRDANHDGPHRCCCGEEDGDELSDSADQIWAIPDSPSTMSDQLRDRIAGVVRREVPCHPPAADIWARARPTIRNAP